MFWRFGGYANISSLDTILDKPDVTLEELLDESDLIQELKQQNGKLIEFLRDEPVLHKLLRYVVAETPPEEEEQPASEEAEVEKSTGISFFGSRRKSRSRSKSVNKSVDIGDTEEDKKEAKRKKYAYVACEVLSSEVWSITEALLESRDHLYKFWDYLKRPAPLDALQAGYFTKVNETLLDKKTEDMLGFLKSLDGIVPQMLKHVDCPMVMDLLLKMISLEKHEGGQGIVDWLQSQDLIPILLSHLAPSNPLATQTSAGDFLKAIITISANATAQDQTVIGPNELTRQLVSGECVAQLISDMLKGGNPLTVGVGIIIEVIRKNNSDYDLDNQVGPEPRTSDPIYLGGLLRQFAKAVPDFMNLVRNKGATKPQLKAAFGEKIQPLGFDRFKTCELMAELLHCSNMGLLNERGSEAEMRHRDQERERLKAEGKLAPAPTSSASEADEAFASSVDSHGFHHAQMPTDELHGSPENINRLEVQNAADEDGFEKVAVPETEEALPDEVNFDDFNEKIEELPQSSPKESNEPEPKSKEVTSTPTDLKDQMEGLNIDPKEVTDEPRPEGKLRVSLLTQQIQDQLSEAEVDLTSEGHQVTEKSDVPHPEDKPAPLFAGKSSPVKGVDPILGTDDEGSDEAGAQSTATLQPENTVTEDSENSAYETDIDGTPVVGDLLKIQFVEHQVVPTILDFFFRFPWNNFLHNVVYDVVQQVFNGTLERGYNRTVALNLFAESRCEQLVSRRDITNRVLDGQKASDDSQKDKGMRLGYMGHLTLIAEEVCKFAERHPPELLGDQVMGRVVREEWVSYVEGTLTQTRDKDNAVLGGVRPENAMGVRSMGGAGLLGQSGFNSGNANSSALANAGLGNVPADSMALEEAGAGNLNYEINAGTSGLLSGFGDGEEDEDEEGLEGERRERAVSDDEQATATSPTPAVPPPLNIPPSRARRQLAARLAARKKEAEAIETDPDAADHAALETAAELAPEPLGDITDLDLALPTEQHIRETTGVAHPLASRSDSYNQDDGPGRFSRLFETRSRGDSRGSDDEEEEEDGTSSDDDDDDLEDADAHMSSAVVHDTTNSPTAEERTTRIGVIRRRSNKQRERRPSTTEAKVRLPLDLEDDDDGDGDFGGGRDLSLDIGGEGEGEDEGQGVVHGVGEGEGPFADPVQDLGSSEEEEDSSDEDIVEIRPRRTS